MEMDAAEQAPSALRSALHVKESDTVHGVAWYPLMRSADPATATFACVARDQPLHLWDAFHGQVRASYLGYDQMDELATAYSVAWNPSGDKLLCGYEHQLRVFDAARPGRHCTTVPSKQSRYGHRGVMGSVAYNPEGSLLAAGSYSGSVCLYDARTYEALGIAKASGGVTRVQFSLDGLVLIGGCRKNGAVHCWDVRNISAPLFTLTRVCNTNQRIGFDVSRDGVHLVTGSQDGRAMVYNLYDGSLVATHQLAPDSLNSVSVSSCGRFLASGSGQRRFPLRMDDSDEEKESDDEAPSSCDVGVWGLSMTAITT